MKKAIFPGSFNPFTIGHKSIVERGLRIFDHIIIAVGDNCRKGDSQYAEQRAESIRRVFKENPNVSVETYSCLTSDFLKQKGADVILRGVRDNADFEYERRLADANMKIAGVDTVFLISDPEYGYISSSIVRELNEFGYDTHALVP